MIFQYLYNLLFGKTNETKEEQPIQSYSFLHLYPKIKISTFKDMINNILKTKKNDTYYRVVNSNQPEIWEFKDDRLNIHPESQFNVVKTVYEEYQDNQTLENKNIRKFGKYDKKIIVYFRDEHITGYIYRITCIYMINGKKI